MGKILVIAEKPSVARDIARVLGCKKENQKQGFFQGNDYIISWAIGHLVTLAEPEDYDNKYKKWNIETLPILPEQMKLKVIKKTAPQLKILKKLMNSNEVDSLICATDSGREGELIFRYIYDIVKCKKPFQRLWISSMTDTAIKEGFLKLKDGKEYDNLYLSAKCRSEADWLVGMNATRAYTIQYHTLLSIGRVQTPTLAIMTQRQKEINNFIPEDYYEVEVEYKENFKGIWTKENQTKIKTLEQAKSIADKVMNQTGIISNITKEEKKLPPPLLYDLTELQRDCNKKFGFSAQKTLTIAQELYEKRKMITYPRTDSRYLSDDMKKQISQVLEKLHMVERYQKYAEKLLSLPVLPLGKRIIDNSKITDHHAIIPTTKKINMDILTDDEKKVYNTIVIRFLSVFYEQYIYMITKITTEVEKEHFLSKGTTIIQKGWTEIYQVLDMAVKRNKKEEIILPDLVSGQQITVKQSKCYKKKTQPPPLYTENTLLSAMENAGRFIEDESLKEQMKENGLGTPATRAAIIERLLTVGYIERKGQSLVPTEKGMKLIEIVPEELKSPQTTGKWEKGLSSIAKGNMTDEKFMTSIQKYVCFLIEQSSHINQDIVFEKEQRNTKKRIRKLGVCPLCQKGSILEHSKGYYCSEWKNGCKFTIWKNSVSNYGIVLKDSMIKKLLTERKIKSVAVTLPQTGEKGIATLLLSEDNSGRLEIMEFTKN